MAKIEFEIWDKIRSDTLTITMTGNIDMGIETLNLIAVYLSNEYSIEGKDLNNEAPKPTETRGAVPLCPRCATDCLFRGHGRFTHCFAFAPKPTEKPEEAKKHG